MLVNHLTVSKTDQFKVFAIFEENDVATIVGFDVISL